jgi:hypothetical protein
VSDWAAPISPVTAMLSGLGGALGGYWLAGRNEEARDIRATRREDTARVADYTKHLSERRHEWQRQVLLDLQDELQRMTRQTYFVLQQDLKTVRERGKLFRLPDEVGGEEALAATVAVQKLRTRILADDLRSLVGEFVRFTSSADTGTVLAHKDDPKDQLTALIESLISELGDRYVQLVEQLGEHIRRNEQGWF